MIITAKDLADKVEELAQKYPDREVKCRYTEHADDLSLSPVCVVACAAVEVAGDEILPYLHKVNNTGIGTLLEGRRAGASNFFETLHPGADFGQKLYITFLRVMQQNQDKGMSWGRAYRRAAEYLERARQYEKENS